MAVQLRVILDQLVSPTDGDLAEASANLARALVLSAPSGCRVGAIVPSGPHGPGVDGLLEVRRLAMRRRELATAWQLGVTAGAVGGLVHSPTLMAPLSRHDRANDHDQVVVTLWDLRAWEFPDELPRAQLAWHRAMLKRVRKHADAVVVPTHAMAERLEALAPLGGRIRVISGAAPDGFAVPSDAVGRRRTLGIDEQVIVVSGDAQPSSALSTAFTALAEVADDRLIVVLDASPGDDEAIIALAEAAGIARERVQVHGGLDAADRAAVFAAASAVIAPSRRAGFPWRVVEALTLGVPVVAVSSPDLREVIWDGGLLVGDDEGGQDASALADGVRRLLGSRQLRERISVLASDRGRAFSWADAAERVWQLHADL